MTSLLIASAWFLFLAESPHKSLLPLIILLLSSFSLSLLLLVLLLFLSVFLRHSGMSPSTLLYLSRPHPLPFRLAFVFFCVVLNALLFESRACWEVSVNIFELVCAASFAGASVGLLVSLCCCLHLTARSHTFFSSFQTDLSTAHNRCDEFFDCHFSISTSTSVSMSWYVCTAKPITHAFIHFKNDEETNKFVKSANMLKKELRGGKLKISRSMDAEERFHQKRMGHVKYCIHMRHNIPLDSITTNWTLKHISVKGQIAVETCQSGNLTYIKQFSRFPSSSLFL